jgi:two-component system nitrogen regulation response regulator GlnG
LEHFLHQFNRELGKNVGDISQDALELLMRYRWPGNVRELQSVLKQALLHATGSILLADFLPSEIRGDQRAGSGDRPQRRERSASLEGFVEEQLRRGSDDLYNDAKLFMERLVITRVLRHTSGNQSHAAKILGITRGSLRNKIRQLHITIDQVVSVDGDQPRHEPLELSPV